MRNLEPDLRHFVGLRRLLEVLLEPESGFALEMQPGRLERYRPEMGLGFATVLEAETLPVLVTRQRTGFVLATKILVFVNSLFEFLAVTFFSFFKF